MVETPVQQADGDVTPGGTVKKTKIMTEKHTAADNRLVEYFVVVSSIERTSKDVAKSKQTNENDMSFSDWKTESTSYDEDDVDEFAGIHFRPTITARYPLYDHADNPLHENVTFFCHPSGGIQLRTDPIMPKVHYFVATGGSGKQVYGTCLTLWEPYTVNIPGNVQKKGQRATKSKEVFLPKCLVILSHWPYLAAFREYLTQLHRLSKLGEMTLPLERYIANFCSEIAAPPPGSFEVQTTILDSVIKIWSLPHNLPIAWVSLPFGVLFECLDVENIILVWHCLVLERQVLLTSTQLSVLTTASEILLSLLFPMRWSHAYIPVLPHFLIPILSAPMPFLCGINKSNLADALYDLGRECVLVDLDKNLVTLGPDTTPLPPIPPVQGAALRQQLEDNVGMVFREVRSLTRHDDYSDSGAHLPPHVKSMADDMWESKLCLYDEAFHLVFTPEDERKNILNGNDSSGMDLSDRGGDNPLSSIVGGSDKQNVRKQSAWDAVQESFLDTFVYLLRNYRKFLVFPSKHNEGSYGGAGFRSKEFIESQRYDMREFLKQLVGTQMFDNFITKRLYGSGEADVAFFDMAVDRFLKNAGLFSDVALSGRLKDAGGFSKSDKRGKAAGQKKPPARASLTKRDDNPLLQSARVHRKLKTIVPPEPTGDGLPPHPMLVDSGDHVVSQVGNDDSSVHSSSTAGKSLPSLPGSPTRTYKSAQDKAAEIIERQKMMRYTYATFPSKFNEELFGTPRPLPAAVIAEFDRQRKDAAQFRRKSKKQQPTDKKKHIQHAHSTVDPVAPPSPEVATFTVFFMAFSAMVGKELMDIATEQSASEERTILSTYVPSTISEASDTDVDSELGESERMSEVDDASEVEDEQEKEDVAEMKATRPVLATMLGDDDEQAAPAEKTNGAVEEATEPKIETATMSIPPNIEESAKESATSSEQGGFMTPEEEVDSGYNTPTEGEGDDNTESKTEKSAATAKTEDSKPRQRFHDKLSDLQIEEAKALGRAQLGLAFEMLTMMKKRALKADPEAYQALIDACGRVGDTKRATELLAKMHEDGIVADGTVYACLVSAFSAETNWKDGAKDEDLPEWANSTAVEMDWNKLQKRSLLDRIVGSVVDLEDDEEEEEEDLGAYQKLRNRIRRAAAAKQDKGTKKAEVSRMEFFVTEMVERQIGLGENLLEIVFPDISVDTENEVCPRCNFVLSDDDVVSGWTPGDSNDYTTACSNCTQRFVPHFCVQCSTPTFVGSRGPASPLMCERLSPWVLQKEIRSVMSDRQGIENLLDPEWRQQENKNAVLWWNLVLSCMRYRFPFSFLLQGSFEQNLIAPLPEE